MIIKHGRRIFGEIHEVRKGLWGLFYYAFRVLIGWADKLRSYGLFVCIFAEKPLKPASFPGRKDGRS